MLLLILGHTLSSCLGGEGRKKRLGDTQQPITVLEYSEVFWHIRQPLKKYSLHFFALGIHLAARSAKGRALLIFSASWYLRNSFHLQLHTSAFSFPCNGEAVPLWHVRDGGWLRLLPLKVTSLQSIWKCLWKVSSWGQQGSWQQASSQIPQGSLKCLDLMLLNSWYVSTSLFGSSLLLLEFTQFTEVCWTKAQLPLNQLKKWPLLYSSKSLPCSVCLPWDLFVNPRWLPFPFYLCFWSKS